MIAHRGRSREAALGRERVVGLQGVAVRGRAVGLLGAFHPGPALAVTAASCAFAWRVGRTPAGIALVGAAVLAGQCSVGWQNDDVDAERDALAGRRDKPVVTGAVGRHAVRAAWLAAGAATVPLSLASGWKAGLVHLGAVGLAWAYNLGAKATAASFVPYAVSFGLLPCFVTLGLPGAPFPGWWVPAGTALLGLAAHGANVLPDLEMDRRQGTLGLPQRLGRRKSLVMMSLTLLGAAVVLTTGPAASGGGGALAPWTVAAGLAGSAGCCGAAIAAGMRRAGSRAPFAAVVAAALIDVALVVAQARPVG